MSNYHIRPAESLDQAALLALCAVPVKGMISLAFERSPDFFAGSAVQCDEPEVYVCEATNTRQLIAMFATGKRRVWLDGRPGVVRYFSDLRIATSASGSRVFFAIARYVQEQGLANIPAQTIIFSDNESMLQIIRESMTRSRRLSLPYYHPAGRYCSYMLSIGREMKISSGRNIRRAHREDIPALQAFYDEQAPRKNGAPCLQFDRIGQDPHYRGLSINDFFISSESGVITGICGIWDQKSFKQTRVVAYDGPLKYLRPFANWLRPLTGAIFLPPAETVLPYLNLYTTVVKGNDSDLLRDLLAFVLNTYRKSAYAYLLGGVFEQDPLNTAYNSFQRKRIIYGNFFWVYAGNQLPDGLVAPGRVPVFEVAGI